MGAWNALIEGISGSGKTTVAEALARRGHHVIHGDRALSYSGDPATGQPLREPAHESDAARAEWRHAHHIWDIGKVRSLMADHRHPITFFCGGSRNFHRFIDGFDEVFVLHVDAGTLNRRLAARPIDDFGATPAERALVVRLHATQGDIPQHAIRIDATAPIDHVVGEILARCGEAATDCSWRGSDEMTR